MKKTLLTMLILGLITLTGLGIVKGVEISEHEVYAADAIKQINEEYQIELEKTENVIDSDYQSTLSQLDSAYVLMKQEKKTYQQKLEVSTSSYKLEKLFVKLGNHANSEGVDMQINVTSSSTGTEEIYNLSFIVCGTYISITDFISAVENDSELGFKIEYFTMKSADEDSNLLMSTFVCKEIMIEDVSGTNSTEDTLIQSYEVEEIN